MILTFAPNSLSPRTTFRTCVPCVVSSQSHCFSISTPTTYFSNKRGCAVVGACGKARLIARASSSSPNIAEDLGDISIFTASGEPVMFKHLWDQNEGIAVVALLRHFGCFFCWELASALKEYKPRFDAAGVKLIAVGVGTPNKARILAERAKVFSRYDDFKEALENYTMGATPDDISGVLQQGGMFVFKGKQLLYARKDERAGDHAPLNDIFDVCCKTPVA